MLSYDVTENVHGNQQSHERVTPARGRVATASRPKARTSYNKKFETRPKLARALMTQVGADVVY